MDKKIYFVGDPERGIEIIKILESLGGLNKYSYDGKSKDAYYYIDKNGYISCTNTHQTKELIETFFEKNKLVENFYFLGDKVNGKLMIEYLTSLGAKNCGELDGCAGGVLYYTENNYIKAEYFPSVMERIMRSHKLLKFSDPKHNFKPFDKILVNVDGFWVCDFYSHPADDPEYVYTVSSYECAIIIPFEGNENLVGKEVEEKYYKN